MKRKESGVTLIILVITIIVLLIIAGITLGSVKDRNGIVNQATKTKADAEKESIIEKIEADLYNEKVKTGKTPNKEKLIEIINNEYGTVNGDSFTTTTGNYTIELKEIIGWERLLEPGERAKVTVKDNYTDGTNSATIPAGFTVSSTDYTINTGLVVIGEDGSEFVWVPVEDINTMAQCSSVSADSPCDLVADSNGHLSCKNHNNNTFIVGKLYATDTEENFSNTPNTTYDADSGLREPAIVSSYDNDTENYNTVGLTLAGLKNDYKLMAESVKKYGGFYVGRYETSLTSATDTEAGTSGTAQSKKGVIPTGAFNDATFSWYGLYDKSKSYTTSQDSVQSSMIWGSQYDAMFNWAKNGADSDKIKAAIGNNKSGNIATSGNSDYENDSINNIRDLGGNLEEWTLETGDDWGRTIRGDCYNKYGNRGYSPSYRFFEDPCVCSGFYGSRLTLYIK